MREMTFFRAVSSDNVVVAVLMFLQGCMQFFVTIVTHSYRYILLIIDMMQ
jgi:hypothetical protein